MSLDHGFRKILSQLGRRRGQANEISNAYVDGKLRPWEHRFLAESLLSNIWIEWNFFVKKILVSSCSGSVTRSGRKIPTRAVADNSEARIAYEFSQLVRGHSIRAANVSLGAVEPTWAHPDKIVVCISGLAPSNTNDLVAAFGSAGLFGPKRIHLVRNACAHKSRQNRMEVQSLRSQYSTEHYLDPIDIVWAQNMSTNSIAIYEWIEDLEIIAELATK